MAGRLTWQNVAAPDFSTALRGVEASGDLFGSAATQMADALSGAAKRNRETASSAAMAKALQMRDVDQWDQLLAGPGMKALGINADQVTPEFMQFMQGYREDLATNRADDLSNQRNQQSYLQDKLDYAQDGQLFNQTFNQTQWNNERTKTLAGRDDTNYERSEEEFARQEEERLGMISARDLVQGLAEETYSQDEARRKIIAGDYTPDEERRALAALGEIPGENWTAGAANAGSFARTPQYRIAQEQLDSERNKATMSYLGNETLKLYSEGLQMSADFGDPMDAVISDFRSRVDPSDDNEGTFSRQAGEIQGVYEDISAEYPSVPKAIIAKVIQNSVTNTGIGPVLDGKLKPDWKTIRSQLDEINTPAELAALERERAGIERQTEDFAYRESTLTSLAAQHDLAAEKGDEARMRMIEQQMSQIAGTARQPVPQGGPRRTQEAPAAAGSPLESSPLDFGWAMEQAANSGVSPRIAGAPAPQAQSTATAPADPGRPSSGRNNRGGAGPDLAPAPVLDGGRENPGMTLQDMGFPEVRAPQMPQIMPNVDSGDSRRRRASTAPAPLATPSVPDDPQALQELTDNIVNSNFPEEDKTALLDTMKALNTNRDPLTGRELSPAQKASYERRLLRILDKVEVPGGNPPNFTMGLSGWMR